MIEHFSANRCTLAAGTFSLFCRVPVGLIGIAMAGLLVAKGKFASLVIHGAAPIRDEGLRVIRKGFTAVKSSIR